MRGDVVVINTSPAVSIQRQARYIASVLIKDGFNVGVFSYLDSALAIRFATLHSAKVAINVMDPFNSFYFIPGVSGVRDVITYFTADGVPSGHPQVEVVKNVCKSTYVIANSSFSKANLEAIDCHVSEVVPNGVDFPPYEVPVRYTFSSSGFLNPGGPVRYMDRKGMPALIGLLLRLSRRFKFTAHVHTSPEVLDVFRGLSTGVVSMREKVLGMDATVVIMRVDERYRGPFAVNSEPDDSHPIKLTFAGSLSDRDAFAVYDGAYYLSNAYVEGFGVTPFEALAVGRFVIVNDLPTFREFLPSECSIRVPIHSVKEYLWGRTALNTSGSLLMRFHIPDFSVWEDVLVKAVSGEIRYDPRECRESVSRYHFLSVYRRFSELLG